MDKVRDYPPTRRRRGEMKDAGLMMLSARIDEELCEYVRNAALESRMSKQDIVAEALRLHRIHSQHASADIAGVTAMANIPHDILHEPTSGD